MKTKFSVDEMSEVLEDAEQREILILLLEHPTAGYALVANCQALRCEVSTDLPRLSIADDGTWDAVRGPQLRGYWYAMTGVRAQLERVAESALARHTAIIEAGKLVSVAQAWPHAASEDEPIPFIPTENWLKT